MSSNSRMTRSKGPVEELSLPPTRMRKDVSAANEGEENAQGRVQANVQSQQRTVDMPSPFARPGSRAGTCTMPTSEGEMLPKASNPFSQPDSRAGFALPEPTSPQSSVSSTRDNQLQEDVNTSASWDLVDTDTDAEVANINTRNGTLQFHSKLHENRSIRRPNNESREIRAILVKSYQSLLPNCTPTFLQQISRNSLNSRILRANDTKLTNFALISTNLLFYFIDSHKTGSSTLLARITQIPQP